MRDGNMRASWNTAPQSFTDLELIDFDGSELATIALIEEELGNSRNGLENSLRRGASIEDAEDYSDEE